MKTHQTPVGSLDRLFGASMIVAPALLLVSTLAYIAGGGLEEARSGGVIQIFAMGLWILVVMGLSRLLEPSSPRAAVLLAVIGALGVTGGIAYGMDSIHVAVTGQSAEDMGYAALSLYVPGLLFPASMIGFGAALSRVNVVPRWAALTILLAGILFPVSRIGSIEPLALVVDSIFVLALAPIGWRLLAQSQPDEAVADLMPQHQAKLT